MRSLYLRPQSFSPPKSLGHGISIDRIDLNDWPLYRVSASGSDSSSKSSETRAAMVYIHGGAFYREILGPHWKFLAQVARETGLDILVPIYPLIPRPTATADRLAQGFMDICRLSTQPVVCIGGDSAGGMLAIATAQQLQKNDHELAARVRCVVLISPCLDTSLSHPELFEMEKNDPWLAVDGMKVLMPYLSGGLPMDDPRVSPLHGEIEGLPPVMMLAGTHDMICSDARRLSAKYQGKGTDRGVPGSFHNDKLTYIEYPEMIHVYPLLPHAEGAEARGFIMDFIRQHIA
jgi:acetyl esterase/lipase